MISDLKHYYVIELVSKVLVTSSNQPTNVYANSKEVDTLRSQVHTINVSSKNKNKNCR